jgi:hypothetical protein
VLGVMKTTIALALLLSASSAHTALQTVRLAATCDAQTATSNRLLHEYHGHSVCLDTSKPHTEYQPGQARLTVLSKDTVRIEFRCTVEQSERNFFKANSFKDIALVASNKTISMATALERKPWQHCGYLTMSANRAFETCEALAKAWDLPPNSCFNFCPVTGQGTGICVTRPKR